MNKNDLIHCTLVPIDFSGTSLHALEHASAIANISTDNKHGIIALLNVVETHSFDAYLNLEDVNDSDKDAGLIKESFAKLDAIIKEYTGQFNVTFVSIVAGGKVAKTIANVAESLQAQSIVMGTHGSSGIQALAGSNSSRVINLATCPVVTVREKSIGRGYKNIVLPLDLSTNTKQKVSIAVIIAKYFHSTVHVITMKTEDSGTSLRLENNLKQVTEYLADHGVDNTQTTFENDGDFNDRVITWAQGKEADLIIIMADGETGISDYIFGTMAQRIVNKSTIPVMTVIPTINMGGYTMMDSLA
jgi:nucleotide-binding universal stress UspA family protein